MIGALGAHVEMLEAREQGRDLGAAPARRIAGIIRSGRFGQHRRRCCADAGVATLAAAAPAAKAWTKPRRLKPSSLCVEEFFALMFASLESSAKRPRMRPPRVGHARRERHFRAGYVQLHARPARCIFAHPSRTTLDDGCSLCASVADHARRRMQSFGGILRIRRGLRSTTDAR